VILDHHVADALGRLEGQLADYIFLQDTVLAEVGDHSRRQVGNALQGHGGTFKSASASRIFICSGVVRNEAPRRTARTNVDTDAATKQAPTVTRHPDERKTFLRSICSDPHFSHRTADPRDLAAC
jgi:hypothetical protein